MIAIARSFFAMVLPANIILSAFMNMVSLFPDLSFIHNNGYKVLFLALKSGDYNI